MIQKGKLVEIEMIELEANDRSSNLPEDTKKEPFKIWAKGRLLKDSNLGEICEIETVNGRILKGTLESEDVSYHIDFGEYVEETYYIGKQAKEMIR